MKRIRMPVTAPTTTPGYRNPNGQEVLARTGFRSAVRPDQVIYRLRCGRCGLEYGSSGIDVEKRRCPRCQDGVAGEALREVATLGLFG